MGKVVLKIGMLQVFVGLYAAKAIPLLYLLAIIWFVAIVVTTITLEIRLDPSGCCGRRRRRNRGDRIESTLDEGQQDGGLLHREVVLGVVETRQGDVDEGRTEGENTVEADDTEKGLVRRQLSLKMSDSFRSISSSEADGMKSPGSDSFLRRWRSVQVAALTADPPAPVAPISAYTLSGGSSLFPAIRTQPGSSVNGFGNATGVVSQSAREAAMEAAGAAAAASAAAAAAAELADENERMERESELSGELEIPLSGSSPRLSGLLRSAAAEIRRMSTNPSGAGWGGGGGGGGGTSASAHPAGTQGDDVPVVAGRASSYQSLKRANESADRFSGELLIPAAAVTSSGQGVGEGGVAEGEASLGGKERGKGESEAHQARVNEGHGQAADTASASTQPSGQTSASYRGPYGSNSSNAGSAVQPSVPPVFVTHFLPTRGTLETLKEVDESCVSASDTNSTMAVGGMESDKGDITSKASHGPEKSTIPRKPSPASQTTHEAKLAANRLKFEKMLAKTGGRKTEGEATNASGIKFDKHNVRAVVTISPDLLRPLPPTNNPQQHGKQASNVSAVGDPVLGSHIQSGGDLQDKSYNKSSAPSLPRRGADPPRSQGGTISPRPVFSNLGTDSGT